MSSSYKMLRLPHSDARWDITNICNFPPPSQTSQTFAKYWKKPPRSLYLDKLFLQRKSSRYFQTIRFASLHLSEFVQNCAPSNLSDECFHRFAFIQFAQRWVDLIDVRLSGQIGKMSNSSPIYRSWNNWRNMVKVVTYPIPWKTRSVRIGSLSQREIRSILFVQLLVLIDESGDLERDLANWLDLGHKNIQRSPQIHFRTRN